MVRLEFKHLVIVILAVLFLYRFYMCPNPLEEGYPFGFDGAAHYRSSYIIYKYGVNFWDHMQGNGFPSVRFYSLFPYYLVALLAHILSFGVSYKLINAFSFAVIPILQYLWLRDMNIKKNIAVVSSCFLAIYGVHYRVALFAQQFPGYFSFIPLYLFLIFMQKAVRGEKKNVLFASLFFVFLILSYPPAAYLGVVFTLFYLIAYIVNSKESKKVSVLVDRIKKLAVMFGVSFLISSFWLIPTLIEKGLVSEELTPYSAGEMWVLFVENFETYKDYFLDYYFTYAMVDINSIAPYLLPNFVHPLFVFFSVSFMLITVMSFFLFFKRNIYFSLSSVFLLCLSGLRGILPFYIFRGDHGMDYLVMFITFIFAYGIDWLLNRAKNVNKKTVSLVAVVIVLLFSIYQFQIYSIITKIYNFNLEKEHTDYLKFLENNKITKVYSCGTWFLPQDIPHYSSWGPTLLVQNGIESAQINFEGLMGVVSYGSSTPKFNSETTQEEFYNSLKIRGVHAVIVPYFCFESPEKCSICKKNLIQTINYTSGEVKATENYLILGQEYLPNMVFILKGEISKVNCNKEIDVFYRRLSDIEIEVRFSSDAEDLTCTVAETNYPLWNAYLNENKVEIGDYEGLMKFDFEEINSGDVLRIKHETNIHYVYTAVISIISLIVVVYLLATGKGI
ncbi:MAG: hypothetical protein PHW96_04520 [Candidatus Nanoarchaeia archaeon]|nr:hypothetical protein [Candidatus Nanoarchaeia archaeon]